MTPPTPERLIVEMITAEAYSGELYPDRHTINRWRTGMQSLRWRLAEAERLEASVTGILRIETCACGRRPDPNDVPLDNVPSHHDFSCRFREIMQPVLRATRLAALAHDAAAECPDKLTAGALAELIAANKVPSPWRDTGTRLKTFGRWLAALAHDKAKP